MPALDALKCGDETAWNEAFDWLMPAAKAAVYNKMGVLLPSEVEDVAIEALEDLVNEVPFLKSYQELKPLTVCIAHNRAVSHLRERFAQKRGAGKTESLDHRIDENDPGSDPPSPTDPLNSLHQSDLAKLLTSVQQNLKPEHRAALDDFFLHGLKYEEISSKRGWAIGTVGVYLKRGMDALRQNADRQPELLKELGGFLRLLLFV